jgi:tetratricopeptide (TPR) repeat protein
MTMPIGATEQKELSNLLERAKGNDEAEAHVERVLQAVSGRDGMHNAAAILGDQLADSVKAAEKYKAAGNQSFADGKFENALDEYQRAVDCFAEHGPSVLFSNSAAKKMLVTCFCNMAQACLKLGTGDDVQRGADGARIMADRALELDPTNVKARFRRGCSHMLISDWERARSDFEAVLRVEPNNDAAKRELRSVLKHQRSERESAAPQKPSREKVMAEAVVNSGQCEDPRIAKTEEAATKAEAEATVRKQVFLAEQIRKAVFKFYAAKGDDWQVTMDAVDVTAKQTADHMVEQISQMARRDWKDVLGQKGEMLLTLNTEQRRKVIDADAFVTTIKSTCVEDFPAIVELASTL